MKKTLLLLSFALFNIGRLFPQSPEIKSWILNTTNQKGYNNIPSNVLKVQYSSNFVYITANCIPGYDIGPWAGNPNTPSNQNFLFKITRNPSKNINPTATGLGHIGVFTNGVSIFNAKDAMSYNNQNVWFQNAITVEGASFDNCLGHPAPNGEYHHHLNPTCLYNDSLTTVHSPIIGYSFDGYPIYGAFAFADTNGGGGITRMKSSYRKRNITTRTTLPNGNVAGSAGPAVSAQFPLGYYIEDYEYVEGLGNLDEHNGRFCKTPEYPNGMYCYFVTLDDKLVAEYPYLIGPTYYGIVTPGNTGPGSGHNTISETVTEYTGSNGIENTDEIQLGVYPNPSERMVHLVLNGKFQEVEVTVSDNVGTTVFIESNLLPGERYHFDFQELPKGLYWVTVKGSSRTISKSVVIY